MYLYKRKVQYYETDKMGITHHANYIKWMEEARTALLEDIGLPFQCVESTGILSPVVGLSIDYKKPSTFGDEIIIEIAINKYNGVRIDFRYTMKNSKTNMVIVKATSNHCFIKNNKIYSLKKDPHFHSIIEKVLEIDDMEK